MPKDKKGKSSSDSDEGPVDKDPPVKKQKTEVAEAAASEDPSPAKVPAWELGEKKRIRVKTYKGRYYIDIREFYEKDGQMLPGKKGIGLHPHQWAKLMLVADEINEILTKHGSTQ